MPYLQMRIGLTGGLGCGKSSAGRLFEKYGFRRIDCDAIVHELLAHDQEIIRQVEGIFGSEIIDKANGVDRKALADVVFADPRRLEELESVVHPATQLKWTALVEEYPQAEWVIEIPLLFEKNLQNKVDFTVCVFSDLETQLERLRISGVDREQALARMERQWPVPRKAEMADFTILNDGSIEFLESQVRTLASCLKHSR